MGLQSELISRFIQYPATATFAVASGGESNRGDSLTSSAMFVTKVALTYLFAKSNFLKV
jgi:hypothetical protein